MQHTQQEKEITFDGAHGMTEHAFRRCIVIDSSECIG
jgi:hypothetical protein